MSNEAPTVIPSDEEIARFIADHPVDPKEPPLNIAEALALMTGHLVQIYDIQAPEDSPEGTPVIMEIS